VNNDINPPETISDFITGRPLPNEGAEANRQAVERYLVGEKAFQPADIDVNYPIAVMLGTEIYRSRIDLIVHVSGRIVMAIKCAAGSLESRQREIVAGARLLTSYQVPLSVVSDGRTAVVYDTVSGKKIGTGMDAIPGRKAAVQLARNTEFVPYPADRHERESIIFKSYDAMNVNITRKEAG